MRITIANILDASIPWDCALDICSILISHTFEIDEDFIHYLYEITRMENETRSCYLLHVLMKCLLNSDRLSLYEKERYELFMKTGNIFTKEWFLKWIQDDNFKKS